jgi:hypothetical protein
MRLSETAQLLTLCAAFDRRTIGESDVAAWTDVLGTAAYDDASDVVKLHYATSREWLMPCDVLSGVKRLRAARISAAIEEVPDADPDDPPAYVSALREGRHRVATGLTRREFTIPQLRSP